MSTPEHFEIMEDHAVFRPIGQVSLHQAAEMVTSAIGFARAQNIQKLLVITSALTGFQPPSLATRYFFAKDWAEASLGVVSIAVVARPEMIDSQKFGVTAAANRGLVSNVFTSEDEALAWLQRL